MVINPTNNNKIIFCLALEEPKPASVAINLMNKNFNEDDDLVSKYTMTLLKNIEKIAIDFDSQKDIRKTSKYLC